MLPERISPQANLFALLHISSYTHTEAPPVDFHSNISPNLPSIIIQEKRERRSTHVGNQASKLEGRAQGIGTKVHERHHFGASLLLSITGLIHLIYRSTPDEQKHH